MIRGRPRERFVIGDLLLWLRLNPRYVSHVDGFVNTGDLLLWLRLKPPHLSRLDGFVKECHLLGDTALLVPAVEAYDERGVVAAVEVGVAVGVTVAVAAAHV